MESATLFDLPAPEPDPVVAAHPAGTVVESADGQWGRATATFDQSMLYRYRLSRVWEPTLGRLNMLMLNPSTASHLKVDPTVRRCIGFAQQWGMGALEVTNAFALRSTDPKGLREVLDPVGPANDEAIVAAAVAADMVVVAWGVHALYQDRERSVLRLLADAGVATHALRLTKDGHPGHPLYVPADVQPMRWPADVG